MQAVYTSVNTTEILMRTPDREQIEKKVKEYLKSNSIKIIDNRLTPMPDRVRSFNNIIATTPSKLSVVAADKETVENLVRRFSTIEIDGVVMRRTSYEIARLLRERGYKLRSPSVKRVAQSIGVKLVS